MIRTSAARVASSVFNRALAYRFCVNFAPLDPRKHITMNHNHHNMYLDSYEYGQYPDWVHPCSVAPRTYESNVVNILAQSLSEHFVLILSTRAPQSPQNFSTLNATGLGESSYRKISKQISNFTKSIPPCWENWPSVSS
jgi:hypothetical protein